MARIRSVKPELRTSLVVAEWPREVRYFWVLLWGYLDDHGHGVDDARLIKADCMPLDDDVTRHIVDEWIALIAKDGPLCRYEVDGKRFLHCPSWSEHQRPSHPTPSRIPPCPHHEPSGKPPESLAKNSGGAPETLVPEQVVRAGSREQGPGSAEDRRGTPAETRPDIERICQHLADRVAANGSKRPPITEKWRTEARLLIDRDGRSVDEIIRVIDWCQNDDFWKSNVMAMPKLREKFDQLRLAASRTNSKTRNGSNGFRPFQNPTDPNAYAGYRHRPRTKPTEDDDAA